MEINTASGKIQLTPGELADLIEHRLAEAKKQSTSQGWLDFMKIMLEGYDAIIYALRLVDAQEKEDTPL